MLAVRASAAIAAADKCNSLGHGRFLDVFKPRTFRR
jgi:hypothetical protein